PVGGNGREDGVGESSRMDLRRRQKARRHHRAVEDRRRDSERPLPARLHEGFLEDWNSHRRQWLSREGWQPERQWPGYHVARWPKAISRLLWQWRPGGWTRSKVGLHKIFDQVFSSAAGLTSRDHLP